MVHICSTPFWNSTAFWQSDIPSFSRCFKLSVSILPSCFFVITSIPYIMYLRSYKRQLNEFSSLLKAKTILGTILPIVTFLNVLMSADDEAAGHYPDLILFISPGCQTVTLTFALILMHIERRKGCAISPINFFYYFLCMLCDVVVLYSHVRDIMRTGVVQDVFRFTTFTILYISMCMQVVLNCFVDTGAFIHNANLRNEFSELRSSLLSRLFFSWLTKIVWAAYNTPLTSDHVVELAKCDQCLTNYKIIEKSWISEDEKCKRKLQIMEKEYQERILNIDENTPLFAENLLNINSVVSRLERPRNEEKRFTPNLTKILLLNYGGQLLFAWSLIVLDALVMFSNPMLLKLMIRFSDLSFNEPVWHGYIYAFGMFFSNLVKSLLFNHAMNINFRVGFQIQSALTAFVFRKALRLTPESRTKSSIGEIVNLMSVDTSRISDSLEFLWCIWSAVLQITICVFLLWNELGYPVFAGLALLVFLMPINGLIMLKGQIYETEELKCKDNRVKGLTELLTGMKIIKLYAWEPSYQKKMDDLRNAELKYTQSVSYNRAIEEAMWSWAPFAVMLTAFIAYVFTGGEHVLSAEKAFVSLALFDLLRFPMSALPWGITSAINAYVSIKRLNNFFNQEEILVDAVKKYPKSSKGAAIEIKEGTFCWKKDDEIAVLKNITLTIPPGRLVAVVGSVGAGKSSLLSALLGDVHKRSGEVRLRGSLAYVPQEAWIQNLTLRDNILFGKEYDEQRYERVLDACALRPDLELFAAGDLTEIGERGINLSGGQKQRVSLARAVYQQSDLYLLDDPLSAVDAHVGKHLFNEVISSSGLLQGKTRILVTHGAHWLPLVDEIVVLSRGNLVERGTYEALISLPDGQLNKLLTAGLSRRDFHKDAINDERLNSSSVNVLSTQNRHSSPPPSCGGPEIRFRRQLSHRISESDNFSNEKKHVILSPQQSHQEEKNILPDSQIIEEEEAEIGRVSWRAYLLYFRSRGSLAILISFLAYCANAGFMIFGNFWLTKWTTDPALTANNSQLNNRTQYLEKTTRYLEIYGAAIGGQTLFIVVYVFVTAWSAVRSSRVLHNNLLKRLLRSPMSFYDTTPVGRIVNRFSKDMDIVDHTLPWVISDLIDCIFGVLSSFFVISYTTPWFMVVSVPIFAVYFVIQKLYLPICRQCRRLDSVTKSPVYSHFNESISGTSIIRAYNQENRFSQMSDDYVDKNGRFYFLTISSDRWLGILLDFLGNCVVLSAAILAVSARETLSSGLIGFSLTYALLIVENLLWMTRQISQLETEAVAVERIREYSNVVQEAAWSPPHDQQSLVAVDWPSRGQLQFKDYSTRYRPGLNLTLHRLSLKVRAGERVGIVGRTGAGKSSLTLALFRLIEAAEGSIEVDGVDISKLGLHEVRSRLTILPQDPILFSGSLRSNLDPLEQVSDAEVWGALEAAHLKQWASGLSEGLLYEVGESGSNLSAGQRQLICLGRALLRRSRILVLDEATAAVDQETDRLVMETVRKEFSQSTLLIIAHRLKTIMDADRVIVLEQGRIVELGAPNDLLRDSNSVFHKLADDAGLIKDEQAVSQQEF